MNENPPTKAACILERAPPEIGIPPKTIAIKIFIPIPDAVEVVTELKG